MVWRLFTGVVVGGVVIWLGVFITQVISDKEQLAQMRQINALYEAEIEEFQRQAELTDTVLQAREHQRLTQDKARQKATRGIYEARGGGAEEAGDFDRLLPGAIVEPLRLQYQAIAACGQGGESRAAQKSFSGAPCSTAAGAVDSQKSGALDQ